MPYTLAGKDTSLTVIAETELASAAASIDFSSIPATYRHLKLAIQGAASALAAVSARFNGDSTAIYDWQQLQADGTSVTGSRSLATTSAFIGSIGSTNASQINVDVLNYRSTTMQKTVLGRSVFASAADTPAFMFRGGLWRSTAAINRINLFLSSGNFAAGTVATLYGVEGA